MTLVPTVLMRLVIALASALIVLSAGAQGVFTVNGRLKIEAGDMDGTKVVVYKNGLPVKTLTSGLNKFSLDLDLHGDYVLSFEKEGYVSKKLSFNTRVPTDMAMSPFTPFEFAVSLFKQYSDVNVVVFNQPVGMIRYEAGLSDFDYDTDYTRSIQKQMQQTLAEVEQKQKEETDQASANGKRQAAEARAMQRAEADAAREQAAASKAREEEERKAEVARIAVQKKAEEEKVLAAQRAEEEREQAAQKAEEERLAAANRTEEGRRAAERRAEEDRLAAERQRAEEERLANEARIAEAKENARAELRAAAAVPKPEPPRAEVKAPVRLPSPPAPKPVSVEAPRPAMVRREPMRSNDGPVVPARAVAGEDQRRGIQARLESESRPLTGPEALQANGSASTASDTQRSEELIVEPNKVMTVVKLESAGRVTEYRKVMHKWGGTFYFRNDESISQVVYDREALEEELVDVQPRSKY